MIETLSPLEFDKVTLANGLDVIVRRQGSLPIAAVNLWYHVGSKNEERRQRGFAHLFEHLMFEGSEHYPGDFFQPLQRRGAAVNGSTSTDRTNYFVDLPIAHLELALAMESDRMGHLLPALSESKLRVQKDVVTNEYRQNYANRPYGQVGRILAEALYPPEHPYSWLTIGVMEEIAAATLGDVESFFRRFYVPSNASLSIVGDIDPDSALTLAERYFGSIDGGTPPIRPHTPLVRLDATIAIRYHDRVELDRTYELWPTVPQFHDDDAPLDLLADVLGRGRASRLYRRLVVTEELAQGVSVYHHSRELAGSFGIVATLRPGRSRERLREIVLQELQRLAAEGVEEKEFGRVLNGRVASFLYALDNVGGFGGVADRLNAYNIYTGDPGRITSDLDRYRASTPADLQRVAATYLVGRNRISLDVLGRKAPATVPIDRSCPPAPAPAVGYRAPAAQVRALRCGAALWVIPNRGLPIIAATAVVPAGTTAHGTDRAGLAGLTAAMLDEGTETRSAHELAEAAESLGTHLSAQAGCDGSYVSLQCLTPHRAESFDLALDMLLRPTFPGVEFQRIRGQTLAGLRSDRDSPETRAHRAFLRLIYGPSHPYGVPIDGTEACVEKIEREDLVAFHRARFVPEGAAWIVAGDVDPDELATFLDRHTETWTRRPLPPGQPAETATAEASRLVLIDRPGSTQAAVRAGQIGVPRSTPDYPSLLVFNQILGGQFTSRLNHRLREEKGLTYGVRSQFDFRRAAGPFVIAASLQADRIAEALDDLRGELMALLDLRPPTADELDDARRALLEGQARHFETPSALVSRYAGLFLHDLPPDEYQRFPDLIAGVTRDSVLNAARQHLRPDAIQIVVVADAQVVADQLGRLPWTELIQPIEDPTV